MAVLEEIASLDFFRIRNLTAFFIGEHERASYGKTQPCYLQNKES